MQGDPFSLDLLQDIAEPEPISWWPPAPFWWCLIALLAAWSLYWLGMTVYRWLGNAYRREALRELECIVDQDPSWPVTLSALLKRVALVSFSREQVASLSGREWLAFLDDTCSQVDFESGPSKILGSASFDPTAEKSGDSDFGVVVGTSRKWIAKHRTETAS